MTEYETLPQLLDRTCPDGPPPGLVPVRLCPVQVFGADECDRCMAPAGYGLMDAASAWSDCNRAYAHIYRRDEPQMNRREHETILVWVTPEEAEKFDRVLGDPRGPLPVPRVDTVQVGAFDVRMEFVAYPRADPDADVIEQPVPIPNDDPACACRIENSGMAILGVYPDEACPYHGDGETLRDTPPEPQPTGAEDPTGLVAQLQQEARGFVSEAMLHDLLYGSPGGGKGPAFGYILPPDGSPEGEALWNEMLYGSPKPEPATGSTVTGLFDALGGVVPGARADPTETVMNAIVAGEVRAGRPVAGSTWAPVGCTCPWPWPMSDGSHILTSCPHYEPPPKPVVGRSAFTECRRVDGTWVHSKPHDGCPTWTRGR